MSSTKVGGGKKVRSGKESSSIPHMQVLTTLNKNLETTPVLLKTILPSGPLPLNSFIDTDMFCISCISF